MLINGTTDVSRKGYPIVRFTSPMPSGREYSMGKRRFSSGSTTATFAPVISSEVSRPLSSASIVPAIFTCAELDGEPATRNLGIFSLSLNFNAGIAHSGAGNILILAFTNFEAEFAPAVSTGPVASQKKSPNESNPSYPSKSLSSANIPFSAALKALNPTATTFLYGR